MRTTIEIDAELIAEAMRATGLPHETATAEAGLRVLLEQQAQMQALRALRGIGWEGELAEIRQDGPEEAS